MNSTYGGGGTDASAHNSTFKTTLEDVRSALLTRGCNPKGTANSLQARCPVCQTAGKDGGALSVTDVGASSLLFCHKSGCSYEEILRGLGLWRSRREHSTEPSRHPTESEIIADFKTLDDDGNEAKAVFDRKHKYLTTKGETIVKSIYRTSDGKKQARYRPKFADCEGTILPYRLNECEGEYAVHIVEGEKDADTLMSLGIPATTAHTSPIPEPQLELFKPFRRVYVWADNDTAGIDKQAKTAERLRHIVDEVFVVGIPEGMPDKSDVTDWIDLKAFIPEEGEALESAIRTWAFERGERITPPLPEFHSVMDVEDSVEADWLVDGLIARGCLHFLIGMPGCGKSTLAATLAATLASGRGLFECDPRKVLCVPYEADMGFTRRCKSILKHLNKEPERLTDSRQRMLRWNPANRKRLDENLIEYIDGGYFPSDIDLLVIDGMSDLIGQLDESSDAGQPFKRFISACQTLNPTMAVLIIGHPPKALYADHSQLALLPRGTGQFTQASDVIIGMRGMEGRATVGITKSRLTETGAVWSAVIGELDDGQSWTESLKLEATGQSKRREAEARIEEIANRVGPQLARLTEELPAERRLYHFRALDRAFIRQEAVIKAFDDGINEYDADDRHKVVERLIFDGILAKRRESVKRKYSDTRREEVWILTLPEA